MKYLIAITFFVGSCTAIQPTKNAKIGENKPKPADIASPIEPEKVVDFSDPATLVYKTKADYTQHVPVTLSDDKTKIIAYPAPKDLYTNGKLAYPTRLSNGYFLDNRGINLNTAFLKMTYTQYSQLKEVPPLKELYQQIIDKDPLTELCNCGNRLQFKTTEGIDSLVKQQLKPCKRIK
jgi:hypothetical protein